MMQIPRFLLRDSMTVTLPPEGADYAGEGGERRTVAPVCFQGASRLQRTEWSLADGASGRVFIDAVNSRGAFEVPVGARVEIGGRAMEVKACAPYRGPSGAVHHWEVDVG